MKTFALILFMAIALTGDSAKQPKPHAARLYLDASESTDGPWVVIYQWPDVTVETTNAQLIIQAYLVR